MMLSRVVGWLPRNFRFTRDRACGHGDFSSGVSGNMTFFGTLLPESANPLAIFLQK